MKYMDTDTDINIGHVDCLCTTWSICTKLVTQFTVSHANRMRMLFLTTF